MYFVPLTDEHCNMCCSYQKCLEKKSYCLDATGQTSKKGKNATVTILVTDIYKIVTSMPCHHYLFLFEQIKIYMYIFILSNTPELRTATLTQKCLCLLICMYRNVHHAHGTHRHSCVPVILTAGFWMLSKDHLRVLVERRNLVKHFRPIFSRLSISCRAFVS